MDAASKAAILKELGDSFVVSASDRPSEVQVMESEPPSRPQDRVEEGRIVRTMIEDDSLEFDVGKEFYVVSKRWMREWRQYTCYDLDTSEAPPPSSLPATPPPPIDNAALLETRPGEQEFLRMGLQEDEDYELVPLSAWQALHAWYGGGPPLPRRVFRPGGGEEKAVEVYPLRLRLTWRGEGGREERRVVMMGKRLTVADLREKAEQLFRVPKDQVRLWDCFTPSQPQELTADGRSLEDAQLQMDNEILAEPISASSSAAPSSASASADRDLGPSRVTIAGGPLSQYSGESNGAALLLPTPFSGTPTTLPALGSSWSPIRSTAADSASSPASPATATTAAAPALTSAAAAAGSAADFTDRLGSRFGFGSSASSSGGGSSALVSAPSASAPPPGLAGLVNLGNTCFMNSALQCLAHTAPLVEYFLGDFAREINTTNPLGMEGELAASFGELLRRLWAPGNEAVPPRAFKARLSKFAPQFSGYNQHDSQELLAFLLDGLHEDLNRVRRKPYIENRDGDGRPDAEVAAEYWANHKARNDSIIVDKFQGQYKSTLVCPVCGKVSVTFDPFMYLSLPLPAKTTRTITITVVSARGRHPPKPVTLTVPRTANVAALLRLVGEKSELAPEEKLLLTEVYNSRVFKLLTPLVPMNAIEDRDRLVAYRLPRACESPIAIVQRVKEQSPVTKDCYWKVFGLPLLLPASRSSITCGADLYTLTKAAVKPFLTPHFKEPKVPAPAPAATGASMLAEPTAAAAGDASAPARQERGTAAAEGTARTLPEGNGAVEERGNGWELVTHQGQREGEPGEGVARQAQHQEQKLTEGHQDVEKAGDPCNKDSGDAPPKPPPCPYKLATTLRFQPDAPDEPIADTFMSDLPRSFHSLDIVHKELATLVLDWQEPVGPDQRYDLSAIEDAPEAQEPWGRQELFRPRERESVTLGSCMEAFLREEPLGPEDMWYCPRCKEHRQASKKLDLWRLPEVLVVHLKRFSFSRYYKTKLDAMVEFPVARLDLRQHLPAGEQAEGSTYELYAISNHFGGMGGGHYTAYAKHPNGSWYCFDDSFVSRVEESALTTSAAYVLFYRRVQPSAAPSPALAGALGKGKGLLDAIGGGGGGAQGEGGQAGGGDIVLRVGRLPPVGGEASAGEEHGEVASSEVEDMDHDSDLQE